MSYSLCQLLTNIDGNLLGRGEIDYTGMSDHLIPLGEFKVPYKLLVMFIHQALLRDFGKGEEVGELEVRGYLTGIKDELISVGSIQKYISLVYVM